MRTIKFRAWDSDAKKMFKAWRLTQEQSEYDGLFVMQFTGLLDKNGKEIYEGDLIRHPEFEPETVVWNLGVFSCSSGSSFYPFCKYAEVIGNIHENPELLR